MRLTPPFRRLIGMAALVGTIAAGAPAFGPAFADSIPAASSPGTPLMPTAVPSAPLSVAAYPGNQSVALSWKPPADNGGAPIISYTVMWATNANGPFQFFATTSKLSFLASSAYFNNGTPYYFRVRANNSDGAGIGSATVSAVPRTVPGKVPSCSAVQSSPGSRWVVVNWQKPATNGGSPITFYEITFYKNGYWYASHTVPAQTNFVDAIELNYGPYQYRVQALNTAGYGPACGTAITVY